MAKDKPESAAVKAFKAKYGNAKKPFPNMEAEALAAAEKRNEAPPAPKVKAEKKKVEKKSKPVKSKSAEVSDPAREKVLKQAKELLQAGQKHLEDFTSDHVDEKKNEKAITLGAPDAKKKKK